MCAASRSTTSRSRPTSIPIPRSSCSATTCELPMAVQRSLFRSAMPADAAALHDWHARPGAFLRLSPPWQRVTLEEAPRGLSAGTRAILRVHLGPFSRRWVAEHVEHVPGERFRDVQRSGPFRSFDHTHRFLPAPGGSLLEDQIDWEAPMAPFSAPAGSVLRFTARSRGTIASPRSTCAAISGVVP
ncbi:MAG: SRPBCC family protein [Deltaproteobacteria bacterium]|nr:SRPBCC family protein [Deltaproteobacteria bacterium]